MTSLFLKVTMLLLFSVTSFENISSYSYDKQVVENSSPHHSHENSNNEENVSDSEESCEEALTNSNNFEYIDENSFKRCLGSLPCYKIPFLEMELRPPKAHLS